MSTLRKVNVTFGYDDEKLYAIKMYMGQKDLDFSEEIIKSVDGMYTKYVPLTVRDFIDMREKNKPSPKPKKPKVESEVSS